MEDQVSAFMSTNSEVCIHAAMKCSFMALMGHFVAKYTLLHRLLEGAQLGSGDGKGCFVHCRGGGMRYSCFIHHCMVFCSDLCTVQMMQIYENSQEVTKANEGLAVDPYDATNENAMDPYELDATLRQGAHNNKLRKACVDLETKILEMHAGEYTDPIQYQLSCAHKKAIENLDALEASMKWSLTTTYDVQKLQRDCGLELSLQELCRADASPNYFDLIPLKKEMNALRKKVQKEEIIRPESAGCCCCGCCCGCCCCCCSVRLCVVAVCCKIFIFFCCLLREALSNFHGLQE